MNLTSIKVNGYPIGVDKEGYICLSDIARVAKTKEEDLHAANIITQWIARKRAIEYLTVWEIDNNKIFRIPAFDHSTKFPGDPDFSMNVNKWVELTDAVGIYTRSGKNGSTYAHPDITYEFCTTISAQFRYAIFKEYQRLKEQEANRNNPEWNVRRELSKCNWYIQTDAVKSYKVPFLPEKLHSAAYAEEGDILNLALFGFSAKQWREHNISYAQTHNVRDYASTNELIVITALEGINAELIKEGVSYKDRLDKLKKIAKEHLAVHDKKHPEKSFRKTTSGLFKPFFRSRDNKLGMFPEDDMLQAAG